MKQMKSAMSAKLWILISATISAFGTYHYKYDSGREGDGHTNWLLPRNRGKISVSTAFIYGRHAGATPNRWLARYMIGVRT